MDATKTADASEQYFQIDATINIADASEQYFQIDATIYSRCF
jgi:hypothetical protein